MWANPMVPLQPEHAIDRSSVGSGDGGRRCRGPGCKADVGSSVFGSDPARRAGRISAASVRHDIHGRRPSRSKDPSVRTNAALAHRSRLSISGPDSPGSMGSATAPAFMMPSQAAIIAADREHATATTHSASAAVTGCNAAAMRVVQRSSCRYVIEPEGSTMATASPLVAARASNRPCRVHPLQSVGFAAATGVAPAAATVCFERARTTGRSRRCRSPPAGRAAQGSSPGVRQMPLFHLRHTALRRIPVRKSRRLRLACSSPPEEKPERDPRTR